VVAGRVDHHAVENALHLDFHLVEQALKLAGLNELGNVVIGIETLAGQRQTFTNLDGNRGAFVGNVLGGRRGCHKHA